MYYKLNIDIYFVEGSVYSCLYDLVHNILYRFNAETADVIKRTISHKALSNEEEQWIESLVVGEIFVKTAVAMHSPTIPEIYNYPRPMEFAWIELTNSCNLRCIHCYNEHAQITKRALKIEDFKHTVDELISMGIRKIQLIGGEPFVIKRGDLYEMMDYLAPRVDSFEIFLNGTLNTEEDLLQIRKRYSNVQLATSLHSYIETEHERVTQIKGSYQKTVNNIRCAKKIGLPIRFVGTLIGGVEIGEELDFGSPSRRDYIRLSGRGNLHLYNEKLLRERIITEKTFQFKDLRNRLKRIYDENCFSTHIYVGSDMNVYPCPMERRCSHGNIRNAHLKDILKNNILNFNKDNVDGCACCEYRYLCMDCRPDTLDNNVNSQPWYCSYVPQEGKWLSFEEYLEKLKEKTSNEATTPHGNCLC